MKEWRSQNHAYDDNGQRDFTIADLTTLSK